MVHKIVVTITLLYSGLTYSEPDDRTLLASQTSQELSLTKAIQIAFKNSPKRMRLAKLADLQQNRLDGARSAYLPTLRLEAVAGTGRDRDLFTNEVMRPSFNRDHNFYNSDLIANYNLFRGFEDTQRENQERQALTIARNQLEEFEAALIRDVTLSYFKVQLIQKKIEAENEAKVLRQKQLSEVTNRQRAGVATRLEVLQSEYALKNTDPEIRKLNQELQLEILNLQQLTGVGYGTKIILKDRLDQAFRSSEKFKTPNLSNLYQSALSRNMNLQIKQREQERLNAELLSLQGRYWPNVDLRMRMSTRAYFRDEIFDEDVRRYAGEIVLTVPLFNGLKSVADRAALHNRLASQALEQKIEREDLLRNITLYFQKRELAYDEMNSQEANLKLAEESIRQSRSLYEAGAARLTEVLDSYTLKFNAVKDQAEAMFLHIEATIWIQYLTHNLSIQNLTPLEDLK